MHHTWRALTLALVLLVACNRGGEQTIEPPEAGWGGEAAQAAETTAPEQTSETAAPEEQMPAEPAEAAPEGAEAPEAEGSGTGTATNFESERFNIRFRLPAGWHQTSSESEDSLTFEGPDGIEMIVANSRSIQLVDANFAQLNDRVSFDSVNILPDRTEVGPVNGMPAYRVEGDALLRGDDVAIYFLSQAVNVPGEPVMVTIFIPGDNYYLHSDSMKAVLDSIEALNLRPQ